MKQIKRNKLMKIYLHDFEYEEILLSANNTGLSLSHFGRNVCLGIKVTSQADIHARMELQKLHADLGRLGGLLKQAISTNHEDKVKMRMLLASISTTQSAIREKVLYDK